MDPSLKRELVIRVARLFSFHFIEDLEEFAKYHHVHIIMNDTVHIEAHTGPSLGLAVDIILGMHRDPEFTPEDLEEAMVKIVPKFAKQASSDYIHCLTGRST